MSPPRASAGGVREASASRLARVVALLAYSLFVSWLAQGGKLSLIVHPRMNAWIELSGLLCLALAFVQIFKVYDRPRRPDPAGFFVPLAFTIAMTFVFVDSGALAAGPFSEGDASLAAESALIAKRDSGAAAAETGALPRTIVFDDDRYWPLYNRLYDSPYQAAGRKIVVQGFLSRPPTRDGDLAIVARNLMWCCSADMAEIGFLVRGEGLRRLKDSDWVEASGTLSVIDYDIAGDGKPKTIPVIDLDRISPVEKGSSSKIIVPF